MLHKIARYWRTVKYLKPVQLRYQLYYRLRGLFPGSKKTAAPRTVPPVNHDLEFAAWIPARRSYKRKTFSFLNKTKRFEESINWNFEEYGKLWTYNLNYFDYLLQPDMSRDKGLKMICAFVKSYQQNNAGMEPYPVSLRTMNWIKFCLKFDIKNKPVQTSLFSQLNSLAKNVEYHLMGNHLIENGCALLMGGIYFGEKKILNKGKRILRQQVEEQTLDDGAHFERSPMYHQIILSRLLDCYNLCKNASLSDDDFTQFLKRKTELMLGWLTNIIFSNGSIPRVNDTANHIAPPAEQILDYAKRLGIYIADVPLGASGYRVIRNGNYECFIDVGDIGPDYIPGHAHSDTLSFILHVNRKPLMVDTGISTYDESERRATERSTAAHNTVKVGGEEQTEVWKSFRVGRRAHITEMDEGSNYISAEHNGYKHLGIRHRRRFEWSDGELFINDVILGENQVSATAYFHFHPQVEVRRQGDEIMAAETTLSFSGDYRIEVKTYRYAQGYNRLKTASVVEVGFGNNLETRISL